MSSEESLSVRSISVDVETPETEQVMATVAGLAKLGSMDGGAPLSPPDFSLLHSTPPGGGGDPEEPEVSADATPVEENNKGSGDDRGTIPFESISKMSTTSSSESEGEEEDRGGEGGGGGEITSEMRYRRSRE